MTLPVVWIDRWQIDGKLCSLHSCFHARAPTQVVPALGIESSLRLSVRGVIDIHSTPDGVSHLAGRTQRTSSNGMKSSPQGQDGTHVSSTPTDGIVSISTATGGFT